MDGFLLNRRESAHATLAPLRNTAIAFLVVNTVFILLRFFAVLRLRSRRLALTWDDYFLLPAWLCCICISIMALLMAHFEESATSGDDLITDFDTLKPILQCLFSLLLFLSPAYAFTRYSILALYLRIFSGRFVRWLSYTMIALITAQWIAFTFATAFQCHPTSFYWNKGIPGGTCIDIDQYNRSFTPVNVAFDVIILALPLPTIWKLNSSKLRKAGITFILSLGLIALAASLARLVVLETNSTTEIAPKYSVMLVVWLIVEPGLYLITACLPAMQPVFRVLIPPSIRHHINGQIDHARDKQNTSPSKRRSILGAHSHTSAFERLSDPMDRAMSMGTSTAEARTKNKKIDNIMLEEMEQGNGGNVALSDLKQVTAGGGIMVQTEISVTQEQKIEEVLDF